MRQVIESKDPTVQKIIARSFPAFRKREVTISDQIPTKLDSYWDGGSKDEYVFLHLPTMTAVPVHTNHPVFESHQPSELPPGTLPPDTVIVMHSYFGQREYLTIYGHAEQFTKLLPAGETEFTTDEKTVLVYTQRLKACYGGVSNVRYREARRDKKIASEEAWETAKANLISRGLLNKSGALTTAGKNAATQLRGW